MSDKSGSSVHVRVQEGAGWTTVTRQQAATSGNAGAVRPTSRKSRKETSTNTGTARRTAPGSTKNDKVPSTPKSWLGRHRNGAMKPQKMKPINTSRHGQSRTHVVVDVPALPTQPHGGVNLNKAATDITSQPASSSTALALPDPTTIKLSRWIIQVPSGTLPPVDFGWPKVKWGVCQTLGMRDKQNANARRVPKPSKEEQTRRDLYWMLARNITAIQLLMSTPGLRFNAASYNSQGTSGKTKSGLAIGSCVSFYSGKPMVQMPATLNTTKGALRMLCGIPADKQRSLSWVYRNLELFQEPRDLGTWLPMNSGNLFVISEDDAQDPDRLTFTPEMLFEIVETMDRLTYGGLVFDMANEGIRPDNFVGADAGNADVQQNTNNFVLDVLARASTIVMPFIAGNPMSRAQLKQCMNELYTARELTTRLAKQHQSILHLRDHAVIVANAVKDDKQFNFDEFLSVERNGWGQPLNMNQWRTLTSPFWGPLWPEDDFNSSIVYNMHRVARRLLLADTALTVVALEQTAVLQNKPIQSDVTPDFDRASVLLGEDIRYLANYVPDWAA